MARLTSRQVRELATWSARGNRLRKAFEMSGATQQEAQEATGLTQGYISQVVNNRYPTITVDNARKFADFFGCSIEDLFPASEAVAS